MKLDAAYLHKLSQATEFDPSNLEKVIRLRQLLIEFHKHPFLHGKLVLKGGTAVNLFHLGLPRLSVDVDLNYIGQLDREQTLRERPGIVRAVEQITRGLGYKLQRGTDEYALIEWYLAYDSHTGTSHQIQVEINFLMRVCALPPERRPALSIGEEKACEFSVLAIEELLAGKIKAMIQRQHPRDLYDLFRIIKAELGHDPDLMRRLGVLFSSTMDRDFRTYRWERLTKIDQADIERLLYPLLKANDRPTGPEMLAATQPVLEAVLDHTHEDKFLQEMAAGKYRPDLLFPKNPEIVDRIRQHPALLWKAENVARYLLARKGSN